MNNLYWIISPQIEDNRFAWILWYIWKGRNNKVFSNIDIDPRNTLKLAETESTLWAKAQDSIIHRGVQTRQLEVTTLPSIPGTWYFMDAS